MSEPTPRWVQAVTLAAVSVVAAVAAVASYVHIHELADRAGEGWRAHLIPLSVDGMLVAASMTMLVRRRAGLPAGWLPWFGLILGIGASLAANVAAAKPDLLSWVVSGWPPVALAISFELLILVTRDHTPAVTPAGDRAGEGSQVVDTPAGDDLPRTHRCVDDLGSTDTIANVEGAGAAERSIFPDPGKSPGDTLAGEDRAAELIAAGAGRRRLARELAISEYEARALLDQYRPGEARSEPPEMAVNGRSPGGVVDGEGAW